MLKHDWAVDLAKRMWFISNDPAEDADLRRDAKLALEELLLHDSTIKDHI